MKEIAEKLASKPGNIAVWFSTTGKKLVNKVEPGRYAVKGSKPAVEVVAKATKRTKAAKKPAKSKKRKSGLTPEGPRLCRR